MADTATDEISMADTPLVGSISAQETAINGKPWMVELNALESKTDELALRSIPDKTEADRPKMPKATDMWKRINEMMDQEVGEGRSLESLVNEAFLMAMVFLAKSDRLNVELRTQADEEFMHCTEAQAAKYKSYIPAALHLVQLALGGINGVGIYKGDKSLAWAGAAAGTVDPMQKLVGAVQQGDQTILGALKDVARSASSNAQSEERDLTAKKRNVRDMWAEFFRQLMSTKAQILSR